MDGQEAVPSSQNVNPIMDGQEAVPSSQNVNPMMDGNAAIMINQKMDPKLESMDSGSSGRSVDSDLLSPDVTKAVLLATVRLVLASAVVWCGYHRYSGQKRNCAKTSTSRMTCTSARARRHLLLVLSVAGLTVVAAVHPNVVLSGSRTENTSQPEGVIITSNHHARISSAKAIDIQGNRQSSTTGGTSAPGNNILDELARSAQALGTALQELLKSLAGNRSQTRNGGSGITPLVAIDTRKGPTIDIPGILGLNTRASTSGLSPVSVSTHQGTLLNPSTQVKIPGILDLDVGGASPKPASDRSLVSIQTGGGEMRVRAPFVDISKSIRRVSTRPQSSSNVQNNEVQIPS
ncbi:hypothetical protein FHG87_016941 [Trinorchestia longiramus]|nr:hypothetical protein FHG87_016941 [Trinorchestia longiramus]